MGVSLDTGGSGGKKPVDAELNLVPFIDLLVCCICFLLITAVWTQMAKIETSIKGPGQSGKEKVPEMIPKKLTVLVGHDGYTMTHGAERLHIPKLGKHYDLSRLGKQLRSVRVQYKKSVPLTVAVEDGVPYLQIIHAMDAAFSQQFPQIRVSDAKLML